MLDKQVVQSIIDTAIAGGESFIVDLTISSGGDIELTVDSDTRIGIDECARVSRAINSELEALGEEDFSLMVSSAGIGNPLKHPRQFVKCVGNPVEVVLKTGSKLTGTLTEYNEDSIVLTYEEKAVVEGKKRKELVTRVENYSFNEIKSVHESLTIK